MARAIDRSSPRGGTTQRGRSNRVGCVCGGRRSCRAAGGQPAAAHRAPAVAVAADSRRVVPRFRRSRPAVARATRRRLRGCAHRRSGGRIDAGRARFLQLLLTATDESCKRVELRASLGASDREVDFFVRRLRDKLERIDGRRRIVAVRGVGFRFDPGYDVAAGSAEPAWFKVVHRCDGELARPQRPGR